MRACRTPPPSPDPTHISEFKFSTPVLLPNLNQRQKKTPRRITIVFLLCDVLYLAAFVTLFCVSDYNTIPIGIKLMYGASIKLQIWTILNSLMVLKQIAKGDIELYKRMVPGNMKHPRVLNALLGIPIGIWWTLCKESYTYQIELLYGYTSYLIVFSVIVVNCVPTEVTPEPHPNQPEIA
ncbi:hypothetical protein L5515_012287 [Caenorhabditis briggsae]|uniref:Uncharacterized protein n=1 Tax=Caenorhabditis briggsae TaxID=6238 RepID=A0AAE9EX22_CAEBR|nr:hypothetical protein L5515_012287 [Caenorhabditis briggsae]